jgi:methionyl-tRNA synthetase
VTRPVIVIAATPTSNGDLHLGHLAGPYLSGDIFARYLRATGRPVIYATCTDDSQTYVVSAAHRLGTTPRRLTQTSTAAIERSLHAMGISMVGLPPIDDRYRETVLGFLTELYEAGRFRLRTVTLPYAAASNTYLYDGLVTGTCPVCLAGSCGGACEGCGHPNNFDELLDPRSTLDSGEPAGYREARILVLPLEDYREQLASYYAPRRGRWRPHAMQLVQELLAKPLPEVPVTVPGTWGIPAPFPETPGQVIYPWAEAMPAAMYSTWWAAQGEPGDAGKSDGGKPDAGKSTVAVDEYWQARHGAELVYFHGFDNVYHWGLMDLVFLMAHGDRYIRPESNVCNEFYDLAGEKFSTSRNHLIRGTDLLAEVPRDLVRCYLALTAPEYHRTNFTVEALRAAMSRRLVEPWNDLADAIVLTLMGHDRGRPLPTTPRGRGRAAAIAERLRLCYELAGFSTARAAETILDQLARLRALADSGVEPGDLLLETRTLLAYAAPILVDTAQTAQQAGIKLELDSEYPAAVAAFDLPRLPRPDRRLASALSRVTSGGIQ